MPAPVLSPSSDLLLLGKGEVYMDRLSTVPAKTGFFHLGNCENFEIVTEDDTLEKNSSMSASTPVYKKVTRKRTVSIRITGLEFAQDAMALMLMGDTNEQTQAATPVTGEVMTTSVVKGRYYQTAKYGPITAVTVKKAPSTALVLNTDYKIIDANMGIIQILTSSATVTNGDGINIDYTPAAYVAGTGIQTIRGATKNLIETQILFDGDPVVGPRAQLKAWRAAVTPDGGLSLLSEEFQSWQLVATLLDDTAGLLGGSATEPLYRLSYMP